MKAMWRAACGVLSVGAAAGAASADVFQLDVTISGTINGQPVAASAVGEGDSETGVATTQWQFMAIPMGYSVHGSTYFAASSGVHTLAREIGGASNLLTLSGGDFTVVSTATAPNGDQLFADISVSTAGSVITVAAVLSGTVSLPPLSAAVGDTAAWEPGPGPNQFTETFTKLLVPADGSPPIPVENVRVYTLSGGGALERPQRRDLEVIFLKAEPNIVNPTSATIRYVDTVRLGAGIPTVGEWATAALILSLASAGTMVLVRRTAPIAV